MVFRQSLIEANTCFIWKDFAHYIWSFCRPEAIRS